MSTDNKTLAARFHQELFVNGNLGAVDEICAPEFVWRAPNMPDGVSPGPEGVHQFAAAIRGAFSNIQISTDDRITEGDRVVDRWTFRATHTGEFMGVPATGRQVVITGIDVFRISGGRLAELWQNWDQLGMLRQLGAIPG